VADADPMVTEPARHPSTVQLLRYFDYRHLPADLGVVSMQFHHLAHELADRLPDSPELTVALRKLLEGKDAAVRAALTAGGVTADRPARPVVQQVSTDRMTETLHVSVAMPRTMTPAEAAAAVAEELLQRMDRSAAEQSVMAPRRVQDRPQA
jgi:hypothetical protein